MRGKGLIIALALALGIALIIWQTAPRKTGREPVAEAVPHTFHCTLYYTPRETGFSEAGGFDMTPESRAGLKEQKYPRDFLRAVEKEGFGRLEKPYEGKPYIRYWSGGWGFADQPIDNKQRPLVAQCSCAVAAGQKLLNLDSRLRITCANAPAGFERLNWWVADTGSGLEDGQIDLYWGEDDPLGPRKYLTRPKSAPFDLVNPIVSLLK